MSIKLKKAGSKKGGGKASSTAAGGEELSLADVLALGGDASEFASLKVRGIILMHGLCGWVWFDDGRLDPTAPCFPSQHTCCVNLSMPSLLRSARSCVRSIPSFYVPPLWTLRGAGFVWLAHEAGMQGRRRDPLHTHTHTPSDPLSLFSPPSLPQRTACRRSTWVPMRAPCGLMMLPTVAVG
jgi:hypothetical protein